MGEPAEGQAKVLEGGLNRRRENRTLGGGLALGEETLVETWVRRLGALIRRVWRGSDSGATKPWYLVVHRA